MASEVAASLPPPKKFNWEREYGPLWSGDSDTAFWLAPGPEDVLMIDGVRAPLRDHQSGNAKRWAQLDELGRKIDSVGLYGSRGVIAEARKGNMAAQSQLQQIGGMNQQMNTLGLMSPRMHSRTRQMDDQNAYMNALYNMMRKN